MSGTSVGGATEQVAADKAKDLEFDPERIALINTKTGTIWNIADNRIVDARFDRYLSQDVLMQVKQQEYLSKLNEILQLLCPKNPNRPVRSSVPVVRTSSRHINSAQPLLRIFRL